MQNAPKVEILENGNQLAVTWPDDSRCCFHAIWLRDNGHDENTVDPGNGQKLITLANIPADTRVDSASFSNGRLDLVFSPDQWQTHIDCNWLRQHSYGATNRSAGILPDGVTTWDGGFAGNIPAADYDRARNELEVLLEWLRGVARYGVAIMNGLPTRSAAVLEVIALFGYPRETNYGHYFEIRSEINPINLAYTKKGLQSHTDNPYRDPVPGLQLFGCLENSADGGESVVVDGFRAAELLRNESEHWFSLLSRYDADFAYNGSRDVHLRATVPMIECDRNGKLRCIRFNNRSCTALTSVPYDVMDDYYGAYRRFGELVDSEEQAVQFKLEPGQLFITDNTRVLHGRTGYSSAGNRWMQGAYADKDGLFSKIRVLESLLT